MKEIIATQKFKRSFRKFVKRNADLVSILVKLVHGTNYNDPAQFQYPNYGYLKMSSFGGFRY
ncbi:MAG: hypothetical protein GPJ21_25110 [Microcystis aeruginosa W13-11]|nr:hypothetical protein [Microcystis aeruginosa W13-11]